MAGRPTTFSEEASSAICQRLSEGESLRAICLSEEMPAESTVYLWIRANPEFSEKYARAREIQADTLVDEILEISDDASNDWMERKDKDGTNIGWQVNGEHIQRSRLRVDSRKWFASKVAPKKYGEKVQTELTGPNGGPIQISRIERAIVSNSKD